VTRKVIVVTPIPLKLKPCEMAGSQPNLHTMVHRRARIQGVLKVKVKVKVEVKFRARCERDNHRQASDFRYVS